MPQLVEYEPLQVEESGSQRRSIYKRIAIITAAIVSVCIVVIVLAITIPNSGKGDVTDVPFYAMKGEDNNNGRNLSALAPPAIPCNKDGKPAGCVKRIVACGSASKEGIKGTIGQDTPSACRSNRIYVLERYLLQFRGADKKCLEINMQVGECFGINSINNGEYNCNGKCGGSCGAVDNGSWSANCLRHDVCSWWFGSTGGSKDAECGYAYDLSFSDWAAGYQCNASGGKDRQVCGMF